MKLITTITFVLAVFSSMAQAPAADKFDSLHQKVEVLQKKVDAQQEQLLDLKYENNLLRKEAHNNNFLRRGFGSRSRVVVDRRGSKQAYVIYY